MGNLLGAPVTDKETHRGTTDGGGTEWGVSSMQGWRVHMEDAHICETNLYACAHANNISTAATPLPGHSLFAVFDGHGGTFAAMYSGRNLCRVLSRQPKFIEYSKFELERPTKSQTLALGEERDNYNQSGLSLLKSAMTSAFVEIDKEIYSALKGQKVADADEPYHKDATSTSATTPVPETDSGNPADEALKLLEEEGDSGTTACVVLLTPEWVVCANAGDSRAVMSSLGNKAVPLSFDHKPDDEPEERRIRAAGGYVAGGRVEGDLAVSRGLGDYRFKNVATVMAAPTSGAHAGTQSEPPQLAAGDQKVSPIPDITVQNRNASQDEFIIVACDGIWDVQSNYEAVKTVADIFQEGESNLGLVCEECCDVGLSLGSKDNMTALVVKLAAQKIGTGGGVLARRQFRDAESQEAKQEDQSA